MRRSAKSRFVQWLALRLRKPQVAGLNPVGDSHGYELFGEIALKIGRLYLNK